MVEILAAKKALRRSIKAVCAALPATQIQSESARVAQRLFARDNWKSATKVCAFCSMPGEFDTAPILEAAFAANKRVFLPRVEDVKARDMAMVEAFSMADIEAFPRSNWGIAEPPRELCDPSPSAAPRHSSLHRWGREISRFTHIYITCNLSHSFASLRVRRGPWSAVRLSLIHI